MQEVRTAQAEPHDQLAVLERLCPRLLGHPLRACVSGGEQAADKGEQPLSRFEGPQIIRGR